MKPDTKNQPITSTSLPGWVRATRPVWLPVAAREALTPTAHPPPSPTLPSSSFYFFPCFPFLPAPPTGGGGAMAAAFPTTLSSSFRAAAALSASSSNASRMGCSSSFATALFSMRHVKLEEAAAWKNSSSGRTYTIKGAPPGGLAAWGWRGQAGKGGAG